MEPLKNLLKVNSDPSIIKKFMSSKTNKKLKNYYYSPYIKIKEHDYVYLVKKSTLEIFKYGKVIEKDKQIIYMFINNYTLGLDSREYYFYKQYNKYNLFSDLLN